MNKRTVQIIKTTLKFREKEQKMDSFSFLCTSAYLSRTLVHLYYNFIPNNESFEQKRIQNEILNFMKIPLNPKRKMSPVMFIGTAKYLSEIAVPWMNVFYSFCVFFMSKFYMRWRNSTILCCTSFGNSMDKVKINNPNLIRM